MRYFFEISYNGSNYSGWQSQPNAVGIQSVVEAALRKLLRQDIPIVASGRTDAGVHCEQQFFHADLHTVPDDDFLYRLNCILPKDIAVRSIRRVRDDANARYDAVERSYQYRIVREKNVFTPGFALFFFKPLDIRNMQEAAALLVGRQDFESFSKVKTDVNNFVCEIRRAEWRAEGNMLVFTITANRFLRGMVRAIVGTLLEVGENKITPMHVREIVNRRNRREAGANVAPGGLYLVSVRYPDDIFLVG